MSKYKFLSYASLKWIALVSMLIDHMGYYGVGLITHYEYYRIVGRIAFPLYAFMIVEGYKHTKNIKKYGLRLFSFAIITEISFMLFSLSLPTRNIGFTLLLGFLTIFIYESKVNDFLKLPLILAVIFLSSAGMINSDYGIYGVSLIFGMYVVRKIDPTNLLLGLFLIVMNIGQNSIQRWSVMSYLLIWFYNEKKGKTLPSWFFYAFFPIHIIILFILSK